MAFIIKESKVRVDEREIFQREKVYTPFPSDELGSFDRNELIPIGILSYSVFDSAIIDQVLIAVPNLQGIPDGDYGAITYSFNSECNKWRLDTEFLSDEKLEEQDVHLNNYKKSLEFFNENNFIIESGNKVPLFVIGGQPRFGQNWAASLYNEMGNNPELDHYYEVTTNINHPEFEYMSTREIVYLDEQKENEYIFLGSFRDIPYLDLAGCLMVFYQPELRKVMLAVEYD